MSVTPTAHLLESNMNWDFRAEGLSRDDDTPTQPRIIE